MNCTCPSCGAEAADIDECQHTKECPIGALFQFAQTPFFQSAIKRIVRNEIAVGTVIFGPEDRYHPHPDAMTNCIANTAGGTITTGPWTFFGHGVKLLTGMHDTTKFGRELLETVITEGHDITIGEGCWLASGVTVLGPCKIGNHVIVGADSLVTHDLPDYAMAWGRPAKVQRLRNMPGANASRGLTITARIRDGADVGTERGKARWTDDDMVFTAKCVTPGKWICQAFGYGLDHTVDGWGAGPLFVDQDDLIEVANNADHGRPDDRRAAP